MYAGTSGFAKALENAYETSTYLFEKASANQNLVMVSQAPLSNLQVSFYWGKDKTLFADKEENTRVTRLISDSLISRGWMVDYDLGKYGEHLRVAPNLGTSRQNIDLLITAIDSIGKTIRV